MASRQVIDSMYIPWYLPAFRLRIVRRTMFAQSTLAYKMVRSARWRPSGRTILARGTTGAIRALSRELRVSRR